VEEGARRAARDSREDSSVLLRAWTYVLNRLWLYFDEHYYLLYAFNTEPMLIWPKEQRPSSGSLDGVWDKFGPDGTLAQFLQDFGKTLLSKYKPRAIAVFSAHWETNGQTLGECSSLLSPKFDSTLTSDRLW